MSVDSLTVGESHATTGGLRPPLAAPASSYPWLFSAPVDIGVFLGSALAALVALWIGAGLGVLHSDTPDWAWVPAILLIDVAHVWATAFRVYFDPNELQRRPLVYTLVPVFSLTIGIALYSEGEQVFWRTLAYVAIFHFIRQQYGWVTLYRARAGERDLLGRWIDTATIYLATLYPLIYWHAHLPRNFWWFGQYELAAVPPLAAAVVEPIYWAALVTYALRAGYLWLVARRPNPGKDIVVGTTALCWYLGIVWFNSDYAFTVTNVIIHGVPYFALVFWYWRMHWPQTARPYWWQVRTLLPFLATLWLLAYVEELLWQGGLPHRRGFLFGYGSWQSLFVPLLALPQLTHYILDGFIWRRRSNPGMTTLAAPPG
jgi:hypothetical protein